ncbi:MAG TPA: 50S ribosomal protein L11 methyltransferase [Candidatus Acidoferrum sp.]|nr:50S ribosomal protein L11 methyltransferase [Candidatus Acidoferrum sp.]
MAARVKGLWRVSIETSSEAEDAVSELLTRVARSPSSVYADAETHETIVSAFVSKLTSAQRETLRIGLTTLREVGLDVRPGKLSVRKIRRENWAESWKRHFKPLEVSARLLVKPSWSKRKPKRGQAVVILDPGLSFGTGQHPTTGFCLEQLARLRRDHEKQSLLDVGCGSGILAIAATKLGYAPVEAFDFDPEAVRVAKENARVNRVQPRISRRDLTKLPVQGKRFDVVCANLIYDLLIAERDKLIIRVAPDGTLVLAGILNEQFAAVRRAFVAAGMRSVAERAVGEWRSGAFVRR